VGKHLVSDYLDVMPRLICIHALVSGRVQGVGYRAFVKMTAMQLGIVGWIRNLPDGRVEMMAMGNKTGLEELEDACWAGPPLSKVIDIEFQAIDGNDDFSGFLIVH